MNEQPKVTVFMPVYNGAKYLRPAIDSILDQTYKNFELLIIDDGSTDASAEIVASYPDKRIRLIRNEKNLGLVASRNRGLAESRGEYIAVLDCDDVARPTRLEKQAAFLDAHADYGLIGGWAEQIDASGKPNGVVWENSLPPELIPSAMLFGNHFTHSTVMIRKSALPAEGYRLPLAEDYDLWIRMAKNWQLWNLPEILVGYRSHDEGISKRRKEDLRRELRQIYCEQLANLGIKPSDQELAMHRINFIYQGEDLKSFAAQKAAWLERLTAANKKTGFYPAEAFEKVVAARWLAFASANGKAGFWIWQRFWGSPLSKHVKRGDWKKVAKFFIKCLLQK